MELEGAQRCFNFLLQAGLKIPIFISDRHKGIAKWIREKQKDTKHYYDLWHVAKSLCKDLLRAGKESGCEILLKWIKGIKNNLYWSAMSTEMGFGELIVAKWKSIMRHADNKHSEHPDPLFPKCAHDELEPRQRIKIGNISFLFFQVIPFSIDRFFLIASC